MPARDLVRMGVDPGKVPPPATLQRQLEALIDVAARDADTAYVVWLVDGRAVGFNSLKNIVFGERGDMHLHMWDAAERGKGYGKTLFCLAALDFFERFRLQRIVCEPSRANAMPNAMLQGVGFRVLGTRTGKASELSVVTELNTYAIERRVAENYVAQRKESDTPRA